MVYSNPVRTVIAHRRIVMSLLFSLLLSLQVTGAHLHLCLDGQAAPVQVHLSDAPSHDGSKEMGSGHLDEDLLLAGSAPTRDSLLPDLSPDVLPSFAQPDVTPARLPTGMAVPLRAAFPAWHVHGLLPPSRAPPVKAFA